ncbi:MAG TPA: MltA domain-containing protein [Acetobacteraceae bacterium]
MRRSSWLAPAGLAAGLMLLAGCTTRPPGPPPPAAGIPVPPGPGFAFTPVRYNQLPNWNAEHPSEAIPAFLAGCGSMSHGAVLGGQGEAALRGGTPEQWSSACAAARAVPPGDDAAARAFFEANLQPYLVSNDGSAVGLFTGYYEPEVAGSRVRTPVFKEPLYRKPPNPGIRGLTRTEIDRGALANKHLELLWLADPIDSFFLHVQGSGRVRLPDGSTVRVSYDGKNGQPYTPIGRILADRGEMPLDQVTMQSIRAWLAAHPDQARSVMEQNASYVYFKEVPDVGAQTGSPSALGAPLVPMRSIAVDKSFIPLGAPVYLDTRDPVDNAPLQRLTLAHDLGGAIRGPVRADLFFGWGAGAEERAGRMRQQGAVFVLLPKA